MFTNRFDEALEEVSVASDCFWNDDSKVRLFARILQEECTDNPYLFQHFEDWLEKQAREEVADS